MSQTNRVTVVSVAFNSNDVLPDMLASIPAGTPIFVVDNATKDMARLREICAQFNATLIENGDNKGFGFACNRGAERATTEFLFFLNPDASVMPDTLDKLVEGMERFPKASAANPRIALANGDPQFHYRSRLMPVSEYMPRRWPETDAEVTVLMGSALFVRRSEFEAVGGFDENIFLYHEDDDNSRRLRAERGPIMFIRDARVTHLAEKSSGSSNETFHFKRYHQARSRVYAARKHKRGAPFLTAFIGATLAMLSPEMLYKSSRRAKSWGIMRGVLSTLGDGGKGRGKL